MTLPPAGAHPASSHTVITMTPNPSLEAWPPAFHPAPYGEIAAQVNDPQEFVNKLYRDMLEVRPYFPGNTNYTGACLDCVMEQLEAMGATTEFEDD